MTEQLANTLLFCGFSGMFLLMVWISSCVEAYQSHRRRRKTHENDDARQPKPMDRI